MEICNGSLQLKALALGEMTEFFGHVGDADGMDLPVFSQVVLQRLFELGSLTDVGFSFEQFVFELVIFLFCQLQFPTQLLVFPQQLLEVYIQFVQLIIRPGPHIMLAFQFIQ
jgi:hypothetical protein